MIKDHGQSIRSKLLNISKAEKQEYMKVLGRYFHERLLYRISISRYKSNLMLKGSSLLYAHYQFAARPTIDIDLLGEHIDRDQQNLITVFKEILSIPCDEDGVTFDIESIKAEPIAIEKKYPGTNLSFEAHLHTIVYQVSIDIGFGDVVTPHPVLIDYPLLVKGVPSVDVYSYSLETLIAEKFQAMIERDVDNSRMKDFYDLYHLFHTEDIDKEVLQEAIRNTFANRNTTYSENKHLFDEAFANDAKRNMYWRAFLKKLRLKDETTFPEVMATLKENLQQYWNPESFNVNNQ
ncbi:MAG: nucleotidyl transferase AbiEii/AbiGii toxin family protein [Bacteroidaceae bacterium]|nr:nucleotidyl transferase AbiEii/AbiGii toxin family protein [Bacteroidaceae bacterium]